MEICINTRRRSVTIREILHKKENKFVKFHIFGGKNLEVWKIEKLGEKKVEIMGKKLSDNIPIYAAFSHPATRATVDHIPSIHNTLGDKITYPLGRFFKAGFLDNREDVLNTTSDESMQPSRRNLSIPNILVGGGPTMFRRKPGLSNIRPGGVLSLSPSVMV